MNKNPFEVSEDKEEINNDTEKVVKKSIKNLNQRKINQSKGASKKIVSKYSRILKNLK